MRMNSRRAAGRSREAGRRRGCSTAGRLLLRRSPRGITAAHLLLRPAHLLIAVGIKLAGGADGGRILILLLPRQPSRLLIPARIHHRVILCRQGKAAQQKQEHQEGRKTHRPHASKSPPELQAPNAPANAPRSRSLTRHGGIRRRRKRKNRPGG